MTDPDDGAAEFGVGWFGSDWGSPANRIYPQIAVPFGALCTHCNNMIDITDRGLRLPGPRREFIYHLTCWRDHVLAP